MEPSPGCLRSIPPGSLGEGTGVGEEKHAQSSPGDLGRVACLSVTPGNRLLARVGMATTSSGRLEVFNLLNKEARTRVFRTLVAGACSPAPLHSPTLLMAPGPTQWTDGLRLA